MRLVPPRSGSICSTTPSRPSTQTASAKAKIVNLATNVGALVFFFGHGSVLWGLGLVLGFSNMLGGYLGARTAVARGSRFMPK